MQVELDDMKNSSIKKCITMSPCCRDAHEYYCDEVADHLLDIRHDMCSGQCLLITLNLLLRQRSLFEL